jgi:hypothetical protein
MDEDISNEISYYVLHPRSKQIKFYNFLRSEGFEIMDSSFLMEFTVAAITQSINCSLITSNGPSY